jgi:hypothetical protein
MALGASLAMAQGGLSITYSNCNLASNTDRTYPCTTDPPQTPVIAAFHLDAALTDFVGVDALVGLATPEGSPVPDWWKSGSGECREGLIAAAGITLLSGCTNPYAGTAGQGGGVSPNFVYDAQPNHRRFTIAWARAEGGNVNATTRYAGARLNIEGTGADVCAGCAQPACLVLQLVRVYGQGGTIIPLTDAGAGDNKSVTWNGGVVGGSGCPGETPARNRTWGQVKSLYR